MTITATSSGVTRVRFGDRSDPDPSVGAGARRILEEARRQLDGYFGGERGPFTVPVDWDGVGTFGAAILRACGQIPFGHTKSYADVAEMVGKPHAQRAVGNALAANPVLVLIPCHRVIRSDGTIGGYAAGAHVKAALLDFEGAIVGS